MQKPTYRFIFSVIIIFAIVTLHGCHSVKSSVSATLSDDTEVQLYSRLISDYKIWSDVYMPVTLSASSPMDMSISGRATFIRDSEIYISLRMIGIEVAVVYINNETGLIVQSYHFSFTHKKNRHDLFYF